MRRYRTSLVKSLTLRLRAIHTNTADEDKSPDPGESRLTRQVQCALGVDLPEHRQWIGVAVMQYVRSSSQMHNYIHTRQYRLPIGCTIYIANLNALGERHFDGSPLGQP
ncbi:hypothetical protein CBL13_03360 [Pseudomonas putida]|nr:hypothetical protein CBL13_03360 [Pseudomonas putida]